MSHPLDPIADALFLAVRTCATHTAGPLRAVGALDGLSPIDRAGVCDAVARRYRGQEGLPPDRLAGVEAFLRVLRGNAGQASADQGPDRWHNLLTDLAADRAAVVDHHLYDLLTDLPALRIFMEHHVYAVWDFMSLLTRLQQSLTGTTVPWQPTTAAAGETQRLLNELKLAEESDVDPRGGYCSHFALYLAAMEQIEANTSPIRRVVEMAHRRLDVGPALCSAEAPPAVITFVGTTFSFIHGTAQDADGDGLVRVAAAFTLGREQLIPDMFERVWAPLAPEATPTLLREYLVRHIDLDRDVHGPLAERLLVDLCGDDARRWQLATDAAQQALRARRDLWSAIAKEIRQREALQLHDSHLISREEADLHVEYDGDPLPLHRRPIRQPKVRLS